MYKNFRAITSFYKNNPEYLKFWIRSLLGKSQPFYSLIFQITNVCNSRCITCFNWKILNKDVKNELTLEEIDKFTKKMGRLDIVAIGGGEPFLRDDIVEVVNCFDKNNHIKTVGIPTNCLSVDKIIAKTEKILNNFKGEVKIGLSLDGIGKDHDKIRGIDGNFEKFLETYRELSKLKKQYSNLRLRLCTVILSANVDKIPEIIKYAREEMSEVDFHGLELMRGDYNQDKAKEITQEEFLKIIELIERNNKDANFYKSVVSPIIQRLFLDILKRKEQIIPCRASSFCPVIDALGDVYSCENRSGIIGNLRDYDYDLNRIWQSSKAKQARKSIRRRECYCTHSGYQVTNTYLSPKMICKIIRGKY